MAVKDRIRRYYGIEDDEPKSISADEWVKTQAKALGPFVRGSPFFVQ